MGNPKQKWTSEEEEALRAGVAKHGTGKWKNIQRDPEFNHLLVARSNIDLKDKWRNLSVASGQGPRGKSKTPKAKAKATNTPATPLPTAQTSASIAPSSQDASTDVVMLDSSRPLLEGNNAANTRRKEKKIVSSTRSTRRKGKEIILPTQTMRNGKEIVAPTPTRMMTRSATTTPTRITRSNTTKTLTRVTPSRVTKRSGAVAKEIGKSTEKSTTLRKTLGVKRKLKVSKALKQDLAAKLQPQGTDGKPQPKMTDGKLQPQSKVAASISSTLSRPAGRPGSRTVEVLHKM